MFHVSSTPNALAGVMGRRVATRHVCVSFRGQRRAADGVASLAGLLQKQSIERVRPRCYAGAVAFKL
jgi:hypothetical protein